MVFNPSPKVAAARDIAKKFKKHQAIIVMIDHNNDTLEVATYGLTKELCKQAKTLGDVAYDAVFDKLLDEI